MTRVVVERSDSATTSDCDLPSTDNRRSTTGYRVVNTRQVANDVQVASLPNRPEIPAAACDCLRELGRASRHCGHPLEICCHPLDHQIFVCPAIGDHSIAAVVDEDRCGACQHIVRVLAEVPSSAFLQVSAIRPVRGCVWKFPSVRPCCRRRCRRTATRVRAVEWALVGVLPGLGSGMVRGPYAGSATRAGRDPARPERQGTHGTETAGECARALPSSFPYLLALSVRKSVRIHCRNAVPAGIISNRSSGPLIAPPVASRATMGEPKDAVHLPA